MKQSFIIKSLALTFLSALVLTACGGGGGSSSASSSPAPANTPPADPNAFSLTPIKTLGANSLTFSLTGSDTNSFHYTATLKITNTPNLTIADKSGNTVTNVTSVKAESTITKTETDQSTTTVGTSYYASGYQLIITTLGDPATDTCIPEYYTAPPNSALVGDHGDSFAKIICSSLNTVNYVTWRLEAGTTADEAKFVVTETSYVNGVEDTIEEDRYIIDHAGNIKGIEVVVTRGGVIRTLSGLKQ